MKRKITILLLPFLLAGCGGSETNNNSKNGNEVPRESTVVKTETFSKENYDSFPELKNIVSYLKLSAKDIKILNQTDKRLVFCLTQKESINPHDESVPSIYNYVKLLEKDGYQMNLLDGTTSSTFVLEKDKYKLSIITISNIEEWKKDNASELNTKDITNENVVCEIN